MTATEAKVPENEMIRRERVADLALDRLIASNQLEVRQTSRWHIDGDEWSSLIFAGHQSPSLILICLKFHSAGCETPAINVQHWR